MIIAGEIKVLCGVLILPAFCAFVLQTLPLMLWNFTRKQYITMAHGLH